LLYVGAALVLFRSSVLDWNVVPTASMNPTIVEGDYILVNKVAYGLKLPLLGGPLLRWGGPARGDIIVFDPPGESERYVKRVVGVPGDHLEMRRNHLFVNGRPARYRGRTVGRDRDWAGDEEIAGRGHRVLFSAGLPGADSFGPLVVPPGHYFVLGDNRDNSKDSRYFGFVEGDRIVGRVGRVLLSLNPWLRKQPRWARFGLALL
jgi:signal peptidase I